LLIWIVWSHLYSFSFHPNSNWTREYPGQEEIQAYLVDVAQSWGLYHKIRFDTIVDEARWNDSKNEWEVTVQRTGGKSSEYGKTYTINADFLVSGIGQLNLPHIPDIKGLDTFQGKTMHSARWDQNVSIKDKEVVMIGSGATAVQILPEIAKIAKQVTMLQRTPNWVIPRDDRPIGELMRFMYRWIPGVRKAYRASLMSIREAFYDLATQEDSKLNHWARELCLDMMKKQIPDDPELRAKLVPNYPPGCKRILITDDFYPALIRPNVTLETGRIDEVTASGVRVDGKDYNADILVIATGFRTTEFLSPIKIYGENGRSIEEIWADGTRALFGMTAESLPNFGMLYGPNTNLGHNSIILMIESQSRYICELISQVSQARKRGQTIRIAPSTKALDDFNQEIQSRLQKSTFASDNCNSWYKNSEGVITNNWCGNVVEYQKRVSAVVWSDFDISGSGKDVFLSKEKSHVGRVVEEISLSALADGIVSASVPVVGALVIARAIRLYSH
jgi:cation diffusion facilitator CzcD-associated flavoprotein CzcO